MGSVALAFQDTVSFLSISSCRTLITLSHGDSRNKEGPLKSDELANLHSSGPARGHTTYLGNTEKQAFPFGAS